MDFLEDLRNTNLTNIGTAPLVVKVLLIGLVCLGILFAGYYFHHKAQLENLKQVQVKEQELRKTFVLV